MSFSFTARCFSTTTLLFASVVFFNSSAASQELKELSKIEIKPDKCVSMRQEQTCYIFAQITWQVPQKDEYCLYSSQQDKALKCWRSVNHGMLEQDFVLEHDITFTLRATGHAEAILSAQLSLAWVYKKQKLSHSSWRVF